MDNHKDAQSTKPAAEDAEAPNLAQFRAALEEGQDWVLAMIDAMARWATPESIHRGRRQTYLLLGEAFDWPVLAQRLCAEAGELIPSRELEDLLLTGKLPERLGGRTIGELMKERLGPEKYRGFLNFYYGVTVEEAIQHAVEKEVRKRNLSRGARYRTDESEKAFEHLYGQRREDLVRAFKAETGARTGRGLSLKQTRELTYWLFRYRVRNSDKARVASDTRKGLDQLARLAEGAREEPLPA